MTLGERISQCRKQLGLSQEALGERMGVSRQAISKWESDSAIPELDKLLDLSQVFGVRIGWLICEEEAPKPDQEPEPTPQPQLTREMLDAYTAQWQRLALEKPKARKWPYLLAAVMVIALLAGFMEFQKLQRNYDNLQYSLNTLQNTTQRDIQGIAAQVQYVLESYSDLTISAETKIESMDYETDSVTFTVSVLPKTYTEGMRVVFRADSGDAVVEVEGVRQADRRFTALISCPLTDDITLQADFISGDVTETKQLENYDELHRLSFGFWNIIWPLSFNVRDGAFIDRYCEVYYDPEPYYDETLPLAEIASLEMALYEDGEKIAVYEQIHGVPQEIIFIDGSTSEAVPAQTADINGVHGGASGRMVNVYFRYPQDVRLDMKAHSYQEILTVTDVYGRTLQVVNEG